jgi:hypothetical protein
MADSQTAKCDNHPDKPSMAQCTECQKNLCSLCILRTNDGAIVCESCSKQAELVSVSDEPVKKRQGLPLIVQILLSIAVLGLLLVAVCFGLLYMMCGRK